MPISQQLAVTLAYLKHRIVKNNASAFCKFLELKLYRIGVLYYLAKYELLILFSAKYE